MKHLLLFTAILSATFALAQDKRPATTTQTPQPSQTETHALPDMRGKFLLPPSVNRSQSASTLELSKVPYALPIQVKDKNFSLSLKPETSTDLARINSQQSGASSLLQLEPEQSAWTQLQSMSLPLINPTQELSIDRVHVDDQEVRHIHVDQVYNGVPVLGGKIILHQAPSGFASATGRLQPSLKLFDTSPFLSEQETLDQVYSEFGGRAAYDISSPAALAHGEDEAPQLVIFFDADKKPHLAYVMTIHPDLAHRYEIIVDANTGEELRRLDEICKAFSGERHVNEGTSSTNRVTAITPPSITSDLESNPTGTSFFTPRTAQAVDLNNVTRTLQVFQEGSFFLVDATRPMFDASSQVPGNMNGVIVTANAQGTYPDDAFNAVYSAINNNSWSNRREVSAHYNAEVSYEYFRSTFNRNSIDGSGGTVISFVEVTDENGRQMDNAFWNGRAMFYGNGDRDFRSLAGALDVGGHEMSHGVVQETSALEYQGESGALNESFADIFGAMIDRDDWKLGEDIVNTASFPSGALRDMQDPHNGGSSLNDPGWQPSNYNERYRGNQDNGGVHINSGIPNNAFFRIATAIGKDKAERLFYDVLNNYLTRNAQFIDLRNGLQQRATAVYGANSTEFNAVVNALNAVGIPGSAGGGGGTTQPGNQTVNPGDQLVAHADAAEQVIRLSDAAGNTVISDITPSALPISRPSVSDDGSQVMIATADGQINQIIVNYSNNTVTENLIDFDVDNDNTNDVRNVALSRDGTKVALVTDDQDAFVYVFDLVNQTNRRFRLYTPGSNGEQIFTVDFADVLEFDYAGQNLFFDAKNTLAGSGGLSYTNWDIGIMEVFSGNSFATGRIEKLFGALEDDTSLGNPTLSKNSEQIMAFDYFDGTQWSTVAINLLTGDNNVLWQGDDVSWPTYTASDTELIFNAKNNGADVLALVELNPDKLTNKDPNGGGFLYAADAYRGTAFANGNRVIVSALPDLLAGQDWTVAPNPSTDFIEIFRRSDAAPLQHSFELYDITGQLLASYPASSIRVDVSSLATGTYVLRQGTRSKTFVKQ